MRTGAWRTRRRVRLQGAGCRAIAVRSGLAAANGGAGLRVRNYLRHNDVVKYVGQARTASGGAAAAGAGLDAAQTRRTTPTAPGQATPTLSGTERGTRARVARLILENGPVTAAALSTRLGLTPAAVRRHLDNLLAGGLIEARTARRVASRGRGRPAKLFAITDAGRSAFEHAYDASATSAPALAAGGGEQLCQHHCPVAHVAAEFPQLCEAETEAFARLLGTPVQRLATIAHGDGICTTHVTAPALVHIRTTTTTTSKPGGSGA